MARGQFKLFYKNGTSEHACPDVHYRILDPRGRVAKSGATDASGATAVVEAIYDDGTYVLQVKNYLTGAYETPDLDSASENPASLKLGNQNDRRFLSGNVRVRPYFLAQFLLSPGNTPLKKTKFTAYAKSPQGKEAIASALTGGQVSGTASADGKTNIFFCSTPVSFEFEIPGSSVKGRSSRLNPMVKGQNPCSYQVIFKTTPVVTKPDPSAKTNLAGKQNLPVMISPSDNELLMIPQTEFEEFEEFSGHLERVMAAEHEAKLDLSRALEAGSKDDVAAKEKALGLAEDKVKKELNANFKKTTDLKEVVTLESYNNGSGGIGLRRRYLKTDKYMELRNKRINKSEYKLNIKFSGPAGTKGSQEVKPKTLDVAAVKASFAKIKESLKSSKEWKSDPAVLNLLDVAGNQYSQAILKSDTYEVEAHAQWLRLVGCAGANAEVDWLKKKAQIQGNLQGKAILCEGKITGTWAAPSLKGWMMQFGNIDLGAIRFVMELSAYGFVGAKVVASGAVGISLEGGKQVAKAIKRDPKDKLADAISAQKRGLPRFQAAETFAKTPEDLNGVKVEIDAFAGAEAGLTPAGKIQWLPPKEKDFVSFAEASATVAVNAGAGAQASVSIYFDSGKFKVKVAARLCWGVGCKGAVEFTVDASKLFEFVRWVHYQLLYAGFKKLVYFEQQAFALQSRLLVLCIGQDTAVGKATQKLADEVDAVFEELLRSLTIAEERQTMVNNINRCPPWLVYATPEARGMLLFQITRHGMPSHLHDTPSMGGSVFSPEIHYLETHKKAVCTIMKTVQTAPEWANVMQHMTARGEKSNEPLGKMEGNVLRFLNNGHLLADLPSVFERLNAALPLPVKPPATGKTAADPGSSGNTYLDEYLKYRSKCLGEFPKGYKVAAMDNPAFDLLASAQGTPSLDFADVKTAGLGEAFAGDPGSSLA
ncbi:hypothetical protein [Ideonella sp.]|jgi:hypothetical protein|uniref:hypothetical protein n=1 Tax=Ideonella sp. TaxID=1929293 RepID=UPI0037BF6B60